MDKAGTESLREALSRLPAGNITDKRIGGKRDPDLRWTDRQTGKRRRFCTGQPARACRRAFAGFARCTLKARAVPTEKTAHPAKKRDAARFFLYNKKEGATAASQSLPAAALITTV